MITIGITIDDVLRDFSSAFIKCYNDKYNKLKEQSKVIEVIDEDNYTIVDIDNNLSSEITTVNPFDLMSLFNSKEEGIEFLYEEFSMELFSLSGEMYKGCFNDLNNIFEVCNENNIKLIIISNENNKTKGNTLHFLAKNYPNINEYVFVDKIADFYNHCDYLVTANTSLLNNENYFNKNIKVNKDYNENIISKYTINKINELPKIIKELK